MNSCCILNRKTFQVMSLIIMILGLTLVSACKFMGSGEHSDHQHQLQALVDDESVIMFSKKKSNSVYFFEVCPVKKGTLSPIKDGCVNAFKDAQNQGVFFELKQVTAFRGTPDTTSLDDQEMKRYQQAENALKQQIKSRITDELKVLEEKHADQTDTNPAVTAGAIGALYLLGQGRIALQDVFMKSRGFLPTAKNTLLDAKYRVALVMLAVPTIIEIFSLVISDQNTQQINQDVLAKDLSEELAAQASDQLLAEFGQSSYVMTHLSNIIDQQQLVKTPSVAEFTKGLGIYLRSLGLSDSLGNKVAKYCVPKKHRHTIKKWLIDFEEECFNY
ncbi:MAG: hypothetical protein OXC40_01940 [Proteobacteria bacterium]|nr:hypothetical protein [Pseudomonadota bacterium]